MSEKCPNCILLEGQIAELKAMVAALSAEVQELKARLNSHSGNSHKPPSSDSPGHSRVPSRPHRMRRRGRPGVRREPFSPDKVSEFVASRPKTCLCCGKSLAGGRVVGHHIHQQIDLPKIQPIIREIHGLRVQCDSCGAVTTGEIPLGYGPSLVGPALMAFLGYLNVHLHLSARKVQELIETLLGPDGHLSLGLLMKAGTRLSRAVEQPTADIAKAVQGSPAIWADETGWSSWGKKAWLWVAATTNATLFRLDASRGGKALSKLLGSFTGVLTSDRWSGYSRIPTPRRQLCFSHLKRDFQALIDRGLGAERLGRWGKAELGKAFRLWRAFRNSLITKDAFEYEMRAVRARFKRLIRQCLKSSDSKAVALGKHLRKLWPALWAFVRQPDLIEPTNNLAERMLRQAVIWRKVSQGSKSARGMTYAQRLLSMTTTLQQQGRRIVDVLTDCVRTFNEGIPPPPVFFAQAR